MKKLLVAFAAVAAFSAHAAETLTVAASRCRTLKSSNS